MSHLNYPNESAEYREARNKLLSEEIALRRQIEAVAGAAPCPAARRRSVASFYLFERIGKTSCRRTWKCRKLFRPPHAKTIQLHVCVPNRSSCRSLPISSA